MYAITFTIGCQLIHTAQLTPQNMFHTMFSVVFVAFLLSQRKSSSPLFICALVINTQYLDTMTWTEIVKGKRAAMAVFELLDRDGEKREEGRCEKPVHVRGDVKVKDVSFSYPSRVSQPIIKGTCHSICILTEYSTDVSFAVDAGHIIALVGPSGSGKSTLLSLLLRFYTPTAGELFLDRVLLPQWELQYLRQQMAVVSQEPALFTGTLRDNIMFGELTLEPLEPQYEDERQRQVQHVVRMAHLQEVVETLPNGLDTFIGDKVCPLHLTTGCF
jgi:ABC-type multidrug transport system fused ATPase/permease subunit